MHILCVLVSFALVFVEGQRSKSFSTIGPQILYKKNPAPDNHRCGVCPTYLQKICAFDFGTNSTYIFDNHCIMDMYNCLEGTDFSPLNYDHCLFFGNFAYVHGFKKEDEDYGEDHIIVKGSAKNPAFVHYLHEHEF